MSIGYIFNNTFYPKDNEVLHRKNLMGMVENYLKEQIKNKQVMNKLEKA